MLQFNRENWNPFSMNKLLKMSIVRKLIAVIAEGGLSFILSTWYNIDNAFSNELEISKRNKWFGVLDEIIKNLITLDRLRSRKDV